MKSGTDKAHEQLSSQPKKNPGLMTDRALAMAVVHRVKSGQMDSVSLAFIAAACIAAGAEPATDEVGEVVLPSCEGCLNWKCYSLDERREFGLPQEMDTGECKEAVSTMFHAGGNGEFWTRRDFFCRCFEVKT